MSDLYNSLTENKAVHWKVLLKYIEEETRRKGKKFIFERDLMLKYYPEKATAEKKKDIDLIITSLLSLLVRDGYITLGLGQVGDRVGRVVTFVRGLGEIQTYGKEIDTDGIPYLKDTKNEK